MTATEPLCPALNTPADIAVADEFVIRSRISADEAHRLAMKAITGSVLRPEDIGNAKIETPVLAYVPFWRIELRVEGYHVGIAGRLKTNDMWLPIPLPRRKHGEAVVLIEGRRLFPYPPKLHAESKISGPLGLQRTTMGHWRALRIRTDEWSQRTDDDKLDGEVVQPDVNRELAEHEAKQRMVHAVVPNGAIFADYKPEIRSAACCHVPLFVSRYEYGGHANPHGGTYWVVVCGRSGDVVGAHHPSVARAVARKIRKLLTFG